MIRRLMLLCLFIAALTTLTGIQYIPGNGESVHGNDTREYHYHYHNAQNDFQFFGASKWAVRFNFLQAYPGLQNTSFNISGARLWFPVPGDSVTVQLASEQNNLPGTILQTVRVPVTNNLINVTFPEVTNAQRAWLIISYPTNFSNRFVSASNGGGSNSYYMHEVGNLQNLISMASAGFNCELLFGILGEFVLTQDDIQLMEFSLSGDLYPRSRVYPVFKVYNHSDQAVSGAGLTLVLNTPLVNDLATYDIPLNQALAPRSMIEVDTSQPGFENYGFDLPGNPTQLRIDASLYSNLAENDTLLVNNTRSIVFNIFENDYPIMLVENFHRFSDTDVINLIQDNSTPAGIHRVQYYPNLSDSLSNLGSVQRFNWYSFFSVPRTAGLGKHRITGYNNDYGTLYNEMLQNISGAKTFISNSSCSITPIQESENIQVSINLQNQSTSLFSSVGQSLVFNSRLFVGLFKKDTIAGVERFVLNRWISFADTINTALGSGSTHTKNYSFTASGITDADLIQNYRVYYWLQATGGGLIHYANFCGFNEAFHSSTQDDVIPVPELVAYPNPLRAGQQLTIASKLPIQGGILTIYNVKGQLVYRDDKFNVDKKLAADLFHSTGIYMVQVKGSQGTSTHRISIIK